MHSVGQSSVAFNNTLSTFAQPKQLLMKHRQIGDYGAFTREGLTPSQVLSLEKAGC
jgi:hypothetical protein